MSSSDTSIPSSLTENNILEKVGHEDRDYYLSRNYVGSVVAIGFAAMAGIGGFSLVAPILSTVNESIGPDPQITWVSLVYVLTQAVMLTLTGRLSDIFGRRYFQIAGTTLALIGCIIGAVAKHVPMLIGANTLIGIASASQVSFPYLIAEIVPMKMRFLASGYIYALLIPVSGLAPAVATSLVTKTTAGWRSCYYMMIAINAFALINWILFYHPPSWEQLATRETGGSESKRHFARQIDFGGLFLLSAGLLLFLLGISWGGSVYPWKSAAVLSTIMIGGIVLVCFVCYESCCSPSNVLVPMHLFSNLKWLAVVLTLSMAASMYYAFNIVFPTQVAVLYSDRGREMQGWLNCAIGGPPLLGQIAASLLATYIGKTKYQLIIATALGCAFYGGEYLLSL
ncbi:hypothetical protein N7467_004259 [Penicillium canescens]|nr:hypothetical protein N7467_004259 [Penicillium canescens]